MCRALADAEMRIMQSLCSSSRFAYGRYPTRRVNVAGTAFKAAAPKAKQHNHCGMPAAAFMAVQTVAKQSDPPEFGVLRQILRVPQPGYMLLTMDCISDLLVYVDWFNPVSRSNSVHPTLKVPVIYKTFVAVKNLGMGNLWRADKITPINITLMPNISPPTISAAVKNLTDATYVVLSRDARLTELSHPAWAPNPEDPNLVRYARTVPAGTTPDEIQPGYYQGNTAAGGPDDGDSDGVEDDPDYVEEAGDDDSDHSEDGSNNSEDGSSDQDEVNSEEDLERFEAENNPNNEDYTFDTQLD